MALETEAYFYGFLCTFTFALIIMQAKACSGVAPDRDYW